MMKQKAEMVRNGMILVPNISVEYKGYAICPKLDMGSVPWQVAGNQYQRGYIVTRNAQLPALAYELVGQKSTSVLASSAWRALGLPTNVPLPRFETM